MTEKKVRNTESNTLIDTFNKNLNITPTMCRLTAEKLSSDRGRVDPRSRPPSALLDETPRHEVVDEILEDFRMTFSSLEETLAWQLDAELVFLKEMREHSRKRAGPQRE